MKLTEFNSKGAFATREERGETDNRQPSAFQLIKLAHVKEIRFALKNVCLGKDETRSLEGFYRLLTGSYFAAAPAERNGSVKTKRGEQNGSELTHPNAGALGAVGIWII